MVLIAFREIMKLQFLNFQAYYVKNQHELHGEITGQSPNPTPLQAPGAVRFRDGARSLGSADYSGMDIFRVVRRQLIQLVGSLV